MSKNKKIAVIGLKGLPAYGGAAAVGENIIDKLKDDYEFTVYSISSHTNAKSGNYNNICKQIIFRSLPLKKINTLFYYIRSAIHVLFSNYDWESVNMVFEDLWLGKREVLTNSLVSRFTKGNLGIHFAKRKVNSIFATGCISIFPVREGRVKVRLS